MYFVLLFFLLILPLPIAFAGLVPAITLGRIKPGDERRRLHSAGITAASLSILAMPSPFLLLVGFGFLIIPAIAFAIGAAVAGIAGQRSLIYGTLASPWFPLPLMLYWAFISPPTEMLKFVGLSGSMDNFNGAGFILGWFGWWFIGLLGAGAATLILQMSKPKNPLSPPHTF